MTRTGVVSVDTNVHHLVGMRLIVHVIRNLRGSHMIREFLQTSVSCSEGDLFWPSPVTKTNLHKNAACPRKTNNSKRSRHRTLFKRLPRNPKCAFNVPKSHRVGVVDFVAQSQSKRKSQANSFIHHVSFFDALVACTL